MRLLLTRPRPDAERLAALLRARGHCPVLAPLFDIRPLPDATLDLEGAQAVLLTSANGARAAPPLPALLALPAFAVGAATAEAARAAGFSRVVSAGGDVEDLARLAAARLRPEDGALLHLAAGQLAGDLAGRLAGAGFEVRRAVLYRAVRRRLLPQAGRAALAQGSLDAVLLYSPRAATAFVASVERAALAGACRRLEAFCLSPAVAAAATGLPWRRVRVAARPEQEALLALLEMHGSEA